MTRPIMGAGFQFPTMPSGPPAWFQLWFLPDPPKWGAFQMPLDIGPQWMGWLVTDQMRAQLVASMQGNRIGPVNVMGMDVTGRIQIFTQAGGPVQ